jgi:hypothetical protein
LAEERFEVYGRISKKRLFSDLHFYHFFHATITPQQNIFLLNAYCYVLYGIRFSSIKDLSVKILPPADFLVHGSLRGSLAHPCPGHPGMIGTA